MAEQHVPGLAVAVVDGDRVVWQQGFGSTDDDGATPVTADTIFSVQSMSKTFTATAVMQAVQAGRLDLDVPITTYLPGFTVHSAFEAHPERKITLRMLLSHTAGFTHEAPVGNNYEPEPGDFDAHVRSISDTWLRFPVGTGYAYSNLGIDLAGYILEQVADKPFAAVMRDSLLAPLGMDHSTFDRARVHATADRAVGHSGDLVPPPVDSPMTAAGGLWSSAADLARFLRVPAGRRHHRRSHRARRGADAGDAHRPGAGRRARRPATRSASPARAGGPASTSTCSTTAAAGTASCPTCGGSRSCSSGSPCSPTPTDHDLQGALALGILQRPRHRARTAATTHRMLGLPTQSDVVGARRPLRATAGPGRPDRGRRDAGVQPSSPLAGPDTPSYYRTGQPGAMSPDDPPSRFYVESGVPYFDASEDGTPVRHRLTEFRPGLFLADERRDARPARAVAALARHRPQPGHQRPARLAVGAAGRRRWSWRPAGSLAGLRRARAPTPPSRPHVRRSCPAGRPRRRAGSPSASPPSRPSPHWSPWRRSGRCPGSSTSGFLGWMAFPLPVRLAFHLPLAVALLAAGLRRAAGGRRTAALVDPADPAARRRPRGRPDRARGPARLLAPGRLGPVIAPSVRRA